MHKGKPEIKSKVKARIRQRIRKKIRGTSERPRVFVFKSNCYVYAQVINDEQGAVIAAASTQEKTFKEKNKNTKNKGACEALGRMLAGRLKEKKVDRIVFDRGIYPYHGRIKMLADAMRKEGLVF